MNLQRIFVIILTLISFILLYYGITEPMLELKLSGKIQSDFLNMERLLIDQNRSVLGTVNDLYSKGLSLAPHLIVLFSIIVPILKGFLSIGFVLTNEKKQRLINKILAVVSKWSMADVFVVAIFIAYLSTEKLNEVSQHELNVMGFKLKLGIDLLMQSGFQVGFYYFTGYCLVSLLASSLLAIKSK